MGSRGVMVFSISSTDCLLTCIAPLFGLPLKFQYQDTSLGKTNVGLVELDLSGISAVQVGFLWVRPWWLLRDVLTNLQRTSLPHADVLRRGSPALLVSRSLAQVVQHSILLPLLAPAGAGAAGTAAAAAAAAAATATATSNTTAKHNSNYYKLQLNSRDDDSYCY